MPSIYAEGGNYRIDLDAAIAYCQVWARPDVDSSVGAGFARETAQHFEALSLGLARGIIFDLTLAPPVTGPVTQESIGRMLEAWERAGRPMAVVVGGNQVQVLQLRRLVAAHAPRCGSVFTALTSARAWVRTFE
jgi:hypothetical protein